MLNITKILPTAKEAQQLCPLSEELKQKKQHLDEALKLNMKSHSRLTVVVGPCSADDPDAMGEYAQKLADMQQNHPKLLIVSRVYTAKPHTDGIGYKGLCFQKHQADSCDIPRGILSCREMMKNVLETGLPVADELLFPDLFPYFSDLVSYAFLGARSGEDALHRGFASGLEIPCGVKNPTSGSIEIGVNSLAAIASPCVFPFDGAQAETGGNPFAHIVLRGGFDGEKFRSNLSLRDFEKCNILLKKRHLNDFLMVDLSHGNSAKIAKNQLANAALVASESAVDGVMAESYIFGGTAPDRYGVSKTDDCLDLTDTARLLDILEEGFSQREAKM